VADWFDMDRISVENHAFGGTSSRTFYKYQWPSVLSGLRPGDYVVLQMGHNDGGPLDTGRARGSLPGTGKESQDIILENGDAETVYTFGEYMRRMALEAAAKGAVPILVSLTPRNEWPEGRIERRNETYAGWTRDVALELDAAFVDLHNISADRLDAMGQAEAAACYHGDHTHTSLEGARLNAESFVQGLKALRHPLTTYLK
jgi:lysophospholipase L1-like esterase